MTEDMIVIVDGKACPKGYGIDECKECPRYMDDCDGD